MKICPYCGAQMAITAKFCACCGRNIMLQTVPLNNIKGKNKKARVAKVFCIIIAVFVIFMGIHNTYYEVKWMAGLPFIRNIWLVLFYLMVIIGLLIERNNKFIGILFFLERPIWLIIYLFQPYDANQLDLLMTYMLPGICNIFVGTLFVLKNDSFKKAYFIPTMLQGIKILYDIVAYVVRLNTEISPSSAAMVLLVNYILIPIIFLLFTHFICVVAKERWNVENIR